MLCYIPSKQRFEETCFFFKEVQFSLPSIHLNQESCCHLQACGCFWARQCFFRRNVVVKVGFFLTLYVLSTVWIYSVCCVLKCSMPVFLLWHDDTTSCRCCLFKDSILEILIVLEQFSLNNRNNIMSKCASYPLKM